MASSSKQMVARMGSPFANNNRMASLVLIRHFATRVAADEYEAADMGRIFAAASAAYPELGKELLQTMLDAILVSASGNDGVTRFMSELPPLLDWRASGSRFPVGPAGRDPDVEGAIQSIIRTATRVPAVVSATGAAAGAPLVDGRTLRTWMQQMDRLSDRVQSLGTFTYSPDRIEQIASTLRQNCLAEYVFFVLEHRGQMMPVLVHNTVAKSAPAATRMARTPRTPRLYALLLHEHDATRDDVRVLHHAVSEELRDMIEQFALAYSAADELRRRRRDERASCDVKKCKKKKERRPAAPWLHLDTYRLGRDDPTAHARALVFLEDLHRRLEDANEPMRAFDRVAVADRDLDLSRVILRPIR